MTPRSTVFVREKLACGAVFLAEPMTGVRSASVCILLPAGSMTDEEVCDGRSAMWSELLVRGTAHRTSKQLADAMDRLGASRSTDKGSQTMRVSSVMLGANLPKALPLLSETVLEPRMDEEGIRASRELCLQAIASVKDDPQEHVGLLAHVRHYPTPLQRTGMGTPEGLAACTREVLLRGWEQHALPGGSIIAFAGAIEPDALRVQCDDLFADWRGAVSEPGLGPKPARGYAHEQDAGSQVQILLLGDAPTESSPDSLLEKLAVSVLSGGMSGRLFSEVREKRGLCYSVSAGYRGDTRFGTFTAYVGTTPERAQESLDVLVSELQRINTPAGRVTPEEFDRAKIGMKSGLVFSGESTSARAAQLAADQRRLGRPRTLDEVARAIDAVTLDELNAYLAGRTLGKVTIQTLGQRPLKPPV
jgi:predicted Zn-dependent peptidase